MSETTQPPVRRSPARYLRPRPYLHGWQHGKRGTYVKGCRCDECTDAEALYTRQRARRGAA